ncbi:MAG: endolytic transglycosylase MltG [Calditerricola sp.]|jgi:conserved hypothetical protein, YceG family|nr:endolytic transglycosylase MltG [Bacillota bacterium]MCG0315080.1 endolytic transglycosylase MltG [Calditerricola sp.]
MSGLRVWLGVAVLAVLLAVGAWAALEYPQNPAKRITIEPGWSTARIADYLEAEGLVRNAAYFRWRAADKPLKAGTYDIPANLSVGQLIALLAEGRTVREWVTVTIPEGWTLEQIANRVAELGIADRAAFFQALAAAKPPAGVEGKLPPGNRRLEGYLYPDTYRLLKGDDANDLVALMRQRFDRVVRELAIPPHRLHEVVTIASMVEREAKRPEERRRIAGVIYNRLKKGMKLQIDATVQYALGTHKERLLYEDLKIDSPYNTYRYPGLPPGPIAAPGRDALQAALHPEQHDFYYYVARPDGSHVFSKTYEEHLRRIREVRGAAGSS